MVFARPLSGEYHHTSQAKAFCYRSLKPAVMRIVRIATVPFFMLHHLRSQIDATAAAGHEVMLVASPVEGADALERIPGTRFIPIDIPRGIAPLRDLAALVSMYRLFRSFRPDVVHSTTPKAGLL